jgi:hypothetical protein
MNLSTALRISAAVAALANLVVGTIALFTAVLTAWLFLDSRRWWPTHVIVMTASNAVLSLLLCVFAVLALRYRGKWRTAQAVVGVLLGVGMVLEYVRRLLAPDIAGDWWVWFSIVGWSILIVVNCLAGFGNRIASRNADFA